MNWCCRYFCCCCYPKKKKKVIESTPPSSATSPGNTRKSPSVKSTKSKGTSPISNARTLKSIGTSPLPRPFKSIATMTDFKVVPIPARTQFPIVPKIEIDLSSLEGMVEKANFLDIINKPIQLEIDTKKLSSQSSSRNSKHPKKETHNKEWVEKFFIHGDLSDVIADVKSQTHGCIDSSVSEDIDIGLFMLHDMNIKADAILQDLIFQISSKEQIYMNQFIKEREIFSQNVVQKGNSYANEYEEYYQKLIEEFIQKLELEMADNLDLLQKAIQAGKESVFSKSCKTINALTENAEKARKQIHARVQEIVAIKRKELMEIIEKISKDTSHLPLGYEQFRTLTLEIYSTVGLKGKDQCCEKITDRQKFIKDINNAKPYQPGTKRTVYLQSDVIRQQANRNNKS